MASSSTSVSDLVKLFGPRFVSHICLHFVVLIIEVLIACSYRAKLSRNVSSLNDQSKSEDWKIRFEQERDDAIRAEADLSRRRSSGRFTSQIEQVISVKFLYSHNIDLII